MYRYNAYRGNAEEDQVLIRLCHGLIARSQKPGPRLLQPENSSTKLPARLIDVGLDNTEVPRVVDTAGQTGFYVALSHSWSSRGSSEMQLTASNMSQLRQGIELSKARRCVSDAIRLTRSLGLRYIFIDALCTVQDDHEDRLNAFSTMSDIYSSAVFVIATAGNDDETVDTCIDSSVLEQPFSIFLDWSRPTIAKSFSDRLFIVDFGRAWIFKGKLLEPEKKPADDTAVATRIDESDNQCEENTDSDPKHDVEAVQLEVEITDTQFDEGSRAIEQGVHYVETGGTFEALAFFMKARELVSAFQLLTQRSWKIYATASANIALIYQMQGLSRTALDIAKASMAIQSRLPDLDYSSTLE